MQIKGIEGLTLEQINSELQQGGRFVVFEYCISLLIITFKRSSEVFFIRAGEKTGGKALPYTLITVFLGWWGIPWGPIYSIGALSTNSEGGRDVGGAIMTALRQQSLYH